MQDFEILTLEGVLLPSTGGPCYIPGWVYGSGVLTWACVLADRRSSGRPASAGGWSPTSQVPQTAQQPLWAGGASHG